MAEFYKNISNFVFINVHKSIYYIHIHITYIYTIRGGGEFKYPDAFTRGPIRSQNWIRLTITLDSTVLRTVLLTDATVV